MPKNKNKDLPSFKTLALILIVGFLLANFFIVPALAQEEGEDISELNTRIEEREREINILQKEIDAYAEQIKAKQAEAKGLRNQIAILDNQIAKVNLDIEATEARIEQTNLEIQKINLAITELEKQITSQKKKIAEYIRLIYKTDQVSYLEVILVNESFSDFFDQLKYTQQIHNDLKSSLNKLKNSKQDLEIQKSNWEEKAKLEEELKDKLKQQRGELTEKKRAKEI